jgi:hypothetical protein
MSEVDYGKSLSFIRYLYLIVLSNHDIPSVVTCCRKSSDMLSSSSTM